MKTPQTPRDFPAALWFNMTYHPLETLAMRLSLVMLLVCATIAPAAAPPAPRTVKDAVTAALGRIEASLVNYPKHRQCFSCHHHAVGVFSLTAARERGFVVDDKFVTKQIDYSLQTFRKREEISKGTGVGGGSTSVVYMLNTLAAVDRPYDETTAALIEYLLVRQLKDGSWPNITSASMRPPTMGSMFTNVGLGVSALKHNSPPKDAQGAAEMQKRIDSAIRKGSDWLLANRPVDNEDHVFRLWGLAAAGVEAKHLDEARKDLVKRQQSDGSWAQREKMASDVYATATALVALRRGGLDADNVAYRRGVGNLLATQRSDGAWLVQTRAKPVQRFFDNGDVGGESQFISIAATNWAALALLETMPRRDRTRNR